MTSAPTTLWRAAARTAAGGDADDRWHGRWHRHRGRAERQAIRWAAQDREFDEIWIEQLTGGQLTVAARLGALLALDLNRNGNGGGS